jgi:hypothetical protein
MWMNEIREYGLEIFMKNSLSRSKLRNRYDIHVFLISTPKDEAGTLIADTIENIVELR